MDGAVAYLERDRVALVWADPIAAPEDAGALLAEATAELRGRGLRTCLILVGEETARHARGSGYAVLKIGEQPFFSLADWRRPRGDRGKHLRWCLNRADRAGIAVRPYEPRDEHGAADVLLSWERGLARPAAQSFLRASPLTLAAEKRLFVAELGGRIEAHRRVHARGGEPLVPRGPRPAAGRSDGNDGGARGRDARPARRGRRRARVDGHRPAARIGAASSTAARSCSSAPRSRRSRSSTPATASAR